MSDKYIQFLEESGGSVTIGEFYDKWEPIQAHLLESMLAKNEVRLEGLKVVLVTPHEQELQRKVDSLNELLIRFTLDDNNSDKLNSEQLLNEIKADAIREMHKEMNKIAAEDHRLKHTTYDQYHTYVKVGNWMKTYIKENFKNG